MLRQQSNQQVPEEIAFPVHRINWSDPRSIHAFKARSFQPDDREPQVSYPHRHEFYQVQFITGGRGIHVIDFEPQTIRPPVIHLISPGQVHFWQLERPLQGFNLLFDADFLALNATDRVGIDLLALFHNLRHIPLHPCPEQFANFEKHIALIAEEFKRRDHHYIAILRSYLHIVFSMIQRLYAAHKPDTSVYASAEFVRQFRRLVALHYNEQRTLQFYADSLGVTAAHLSERVKAVTGFTASQIVRQEITLEAKRLLINTDLTVDQISYKLRFNDPAYFGRFFKRETSASPGRYRQEMRAKYRLSEVQ
jgi:AraC-like DNA-binding protein